MFLPEIFELADELGPNKVFLCGGSIKDLMINQPPKDFDFVVIDNEDKLKSFIENINFKYRINSMGGYKLLLRNKLEADIFSSNDLLEAIQYNLDALFYDVNTKTFISFGFISALEQEGLRVLNQKTKQPYELYNQMRLEKTQNRLKRIREIDKNNNQ